MPKGDDLKHLRREYLAEPLGRTDLHADPMQQFKRWFQQVLEFSPDDASSMVLATADTTGAPSARIVLLKHYGDEGFCWYTDYDSAKGKDLAVNPQAALLFYWPSLERQVRISGKVSRLDREHAELYFSQRPRGSQLSAAVSKQSTVVSSRDVLEKGVEALDMATEADVLECPLRWGGYCLQPNHYEFWQGRPSRLHDRFVYKLSAPETATKERAGDESDWIIERLAP